MPGCDIQSVKDKIYQGSRLAYIFSERRRKQIPGFSGAGLFRITQANSRSFRPFCSYAMFTIHQSEH
jgi:hypothetical protein